MLQNLDIAAGAGRSAWTMLRRRARRPGGGGGGAGDGRADRARRTPRPARWRTARSSGWRSACCSCRTPRLLLLDEPVAGMSHEERDATGELLQRDRRATARWSSSSTTWTSCGASRSSVTVLHAGRVLSRGHGGAGAGRPAGAGGLPRARAPPPRSAAAEPVLGQAGVLMLQLIDDVEVGYGRTDVLHGVSVEVPAGRGGRGDGAQRRGQDHAAARRDRAAAGRGPGAILLDGEDVTALPAAPAGARAGWPTCRRASSPSGS